MGSLVGRIPIISINWQKMKPDDHVHFVPGDVVNLQSWIADPHDLAHTEDGCKLRTMDHNFRRISDGPFVKMKDVMLVIQVNQSTKSRRHDDGMPEVFVVTNGGVGWIYFSCIEKFGD